MVRTVELSEIVIPEHRFREDLGDIDALADSIKRFGQLVPIIVKPHGDKYELVAGFRRYTALAKLGLPARIEVHGEMDALLKREIELEENIQRLDMTWLERARAIAEIDQIRRQQNPNWTQALTAAVAGVHQKDVSRATHIVKLVEVFPEIKNSKSLRQALAYAETKVKRVLRVLDVKSNPETYRELEELIWLGDSVELIKLVPDESFNLVLTDPPFGINYEDVEITRRLKDTVYEDSPENYERILTGIASDLYRVIKPNGTLIWFLGISWYQRAKEVFRSVGFEVDECPIVWDRSDGSCPAMNPHKWFARGYDIALHCIKGDAKLALPGRPNILRIKPVPQTERELVVERPIELYQELIKRCTIPGESVADFFVGSGSCLAAAASLGRKFFGIELSSERRAVALTKVRSYMRSKDG